MCDPGAGFDRRGIVERDRMAEIGEIPIGRVERVEQRGLHFGRVIGEGAVVFENQDVAEFGRLSLLQDLEMALEAAASAEARPISFFRRSLGREEAEPDIGRVYADLGKLDFHLAATVGSLGQVDDDDPIEPGE